MKFQRHTSFRTRLLACGKILMIPLLIFNFCEVIIIFLTREKPSEFNRCYMDAVSREVAYENWSSIDDGGPIPLKDVLLDKDMPPSGKTIFFLETSCPCSDPQYELLTLTSRQACAIESAALHNPNLQIFVLFVCPTFRHRFDPIVDALVSYKNVKLRHVNLWRFSENTPVEDWVKKDKLFRSRYLMDNISDLLRFLSLYRFGGIYMDLDVVVLRSFENEPLNFLGADPQKYLGIGVLSLEPNGFGHKLSELFLREFQENYNGDIFAYNGPRNVFEIMSHVCDTRDVGLMQKDRNRCHGIKVFHVNAFYEIPAGLWKHFFDPKFANKTLERLKNSYVTHIWNHINNWFSLRVDSKAAYIQLAAQHCPKVLGATKLRFD